MRISNEVKKEIRAGYQKAARPRQYITEACQKYGLKRETVRKIIGLHTRDPILEEAEGKPTVASWPYDEWAWGGAAQDGADVVVDGKAWKGKKGRLFRVKPSGRPRAFGGEVEQAILADLRQGMTTKDAAARHGCSEDTVRRIRRRNAAAQQE